MPIGRTAFIFLSATLTDIALDRHRTGGVMSTHSTIRRGVRTIVASLFACPFTVWPLSAKAGIHTTHVQNHEMSAKSTAPPRAKTKVTAIGDIKGESTVKRHTNWETWRVVDVEEMTIVRPRDRLWTHRASARLAA